MPSSKATQMQAPEDQHRRLFNTAQENKTGSQRQAGVTLSKKSEQDSDEGPIQLLAKEMDATGNPVPDVAATGKVAKGADEADPYDAMHDDFD